MPHFYHSIAHRSRLLDTRETYAEKYCAHLSLTYHVCSMQLYLLYKKNEKCLGFLFNFSESLIFLILLRFVS